MPLIRIIKFLFLIMVLSGCSIIRNLDQLQALGEFSREKEGQNKIIVQSKANYEALLSAIDSGKMKNYPDQIAVRLNFGEPVMIKEFQDQGEQRQEWLYREALPLKAKGKIYLIFDAQNRLVDYRKDLVQW